MNSYRHCRIRRHILFTQARLAARTRHARTQHPVLVRALVLSWLITAAPPDTVVISPGVTLTGIARAHHLSVNALMVLNPALTDPDRILAGAGLRLPVAATAGRYPDRVRAGGAGQGRR